MHRQSVFYTLTLLFVSFLLFAEGATALKRSSDKKKPKSYYNVLGVPEDADEDTIKEFFRKQALRHHPSRQPEKVRSKTEDRFREIKRAYDILSDPKKRALYDQYEEQNLRSGLETGGRGDGDVSSQAKEDGNNGVPSGSDTDFDAYHIFDHIFDSETEELGHGGKKGNFESAKHHGGGLGKDSESPSHRRSAMEGADRAREAARNSFSREGGANVDGKADVGQGNGDQAREGDAKKEYRRRRIRVAGSRGPPHHSQKIFQTEL